MIMFGKLELYDHHILGTLVSNGTVLGIVISVHVSWAKRCMRKWIILDTDDEIKYEFSI